MAWKNRASNLPILVLVVVTSMASWPPPRTTWNERDNMKMQVWSEWKRRAVLVVFVRHSFVSIQIEEDQSRPRKKGKSQLQASIICWSDGHRKWTLPTHWRHQSSATRMDTESERCLHIEDINHLLLGWTQKVNAAYTLKTSIICCSDGHRKWTLPTHRRQLENQVSFWNHLAMHILPSPRQSKNPLHQQCSTSTCATGELVQARETDQWTL